MSVKKHQRPIKCYHAENIDGLKFLDNRSTLFVWKWNRWRAGFLLEVMNGEMESFSGFIINNHLISWKTTDTIKKLLDKSETMEANLFMASVFGFESGLLYSRSEASPFTLIGNVCIYYSLNSYKLISLISACSIPQPYEIMINWPIFSFMVKIMLLFSKDI